MDPDLKLDALRTKLAVTQAVRNFFGEIGAAMRIDLVYHDVARQEGILRIAERWQSVQHTLCSEHLTAYAFLAHTL